MSNPRIGIPKSMFQRPFFGLIPIKAESLKKSSKQDCSTPDKPCDKASHSPFFSLGIRCWKSLAAGAT